MLYKILNKGFNSFVYKGVDLIPMIYSEPVEMSNLELKELMQAKRFISFAKVEVPKAKEEVKKEIVVEQPKKEETSYVSGQQKVEDEIPVIQPIKVIEKVEEVKAEPIVETVKEETKVVEEIKEEVKTEVKKSVKKGGKK